MYRSILNKNQIHLLPLISEFSKDFYLVGGTAIALQIGHRRSIDFDLFQKGEIRYRRIKNKIEKTGYSISKIQSSTDETFNCVINDVKLTFFDYPFEITHPTWFDHYISMPTLLDLGAMKAFAMGKRSKWKDYVDMYFLLKRYSLAEISARAEIVFGELYSDRLFREQIQYFDDIDYSEEVEFCIDPVPEDEIKQYLTHVSTELF